VKLPADHDGTYQFQAGSESEMFILKNFASHLRPPDAGAGWTWSQARDVALWVVREGRVMDSGKGMPLCLNNGTYPVSD